MQKKKLALIPLISVFFLLTQCAPTNPHKRSTKIYIQQNNIQKAILSAKKWAEEEPNKPDAWMWLGLAYSKNKQWIEAANAFLKGFEVDPTLKKAPKKIEKIFSIAGQKWADVSVIVGILNNATIVCINKKEPSKGKKYFETAKEIAPDNPNVYKIGYNLFVSLKDYENAEKTIEKAYSINSKDIKIAESYLKILLTNEKYDKALKVSKELIKHFPDKFIGYDFAHQLLILKGDTNAALKIIENGIKNITSEKEKAELLYKKGVILHTKGQNEEALKALIEAKNKGLDKPELYLILGSVYTAKSDYNEAIKSFEEYVNKKPEDPVGWRALSEAYFENKKYKEALVAIDKALSLKPDETDYLIMKAKILDKLGKRREARKLYKKIKKLMKK